MPKKAAKSAVKKVKKAATSVLARKKALVKKAASAVKPAKKAAKKPARHGDVLGLSSARVPKGTPRATSDRSGNPKGINVRGRSVPNLRPARVR